MSTKGQFSWNKLKLIFLNMEQDQANPHLALSAGNSSILEVEESQIVNTKGIK